VVASRRFQRTCVTGVRTANALSRVAVPGPPRTDQRPGQQLPLVESGLPGPSAQGTVVRPDCLTKTAAEPGLDAHLQRKAIRRPL
jgi:hypothetical protein